ncbi:MAG: DUF2059 domain-containing protein [Planktomarina sp.]
MAFFKRIAAATLALAVLVQPVAAEADREKIKAFMEITGFDEALKSLRVNARNAPAMLGLDSDDFGLSWTLLADDLFEPDQLLEDGLDILETTLDEADLDHAAAFYASELGQRLVEAENESHFADDAMKNEKGMELAVGLMEQGSEQPQLFIEMGEAVGSIDHSIAAYREVQVRFILTAQAAGLVPDGLSEQDLRAILSQDDADTKASIQENTIPNAAYTYQGFSDADMQAYLAALSTPQMQRVYELMNAIQYTIMADRYEQMAIRMAELHPSQDL